MKSALDYIYEFEKEQQTEQPRTAAEDARRALGMINQFEAEQSGAARPLVEAGRGLVHGTIGLAESVGTGLQYVGGKIGSETLEDWGKTAHDYWKEKGEKYEAPPDLQGAVADTPSLLLKPSWWAYNVADMVPSFAAVIVPGVGAARYINLAGQAVKMSPAVVARLAQLGKMGITPARTGAALAGGAAGGGLEGANTYQEILERGGTKEEAERGMELMTLAAGALNAISVGKIINPGKMGALKKFLQTGATEGLTEYLEEPAEVLIKRGLLSDEQFTKEEAKEQLKSGLNVVGPAFLMGGAGGATSSIIQKDKSAAQVKEVVNEGQHLSITDEELANTLQNTRDLIKRRPDDTELASVLKILESEQMDRAYDRILGDLRSGKASIADVEKLQAMAQEGNPMRAALDQVMRQYRVETGQAARAGIGGQAETQAGAVPLESDGIPQFEPPAEGAAATAETAPAVQTAPPTDQAAGVTVETPEDILKRRIGNLERAKRSRKKGLTRIEAENLARYKKELTDMKKAAQAGTETATEGPAPLAEAVATEKEGEIGGTDAEEGEIVEPGAIVGVEEEKTAAIDEKANEAATSPLNDKPLPTDGQKKAGNYAKGHIKGSDISESLAGLELSIENPRGSERSGKDKGGKSWSVTMKHSYGYFKGTQGKDKDHIDVTLGPNPDSDKAYIVDQIDPATGDFDEHKTLVGFTNEEEARQGYLDNYEDGWKGLGAITEMPVGQLKEWLKVGRQTKAVKYQKPAEQIPEEKSTAKKNISAVSSLVPANTTFKQYVEAKGIAWPLSAKDERYREVKAEYDEFVKKGVMEKGKVGISAQEPPTATIPPTEKVEPEPSSEAGEGPTSLDDLLERIRHFAPDTLDKWDKGLESGEVWGYMSPEFKSHESEIRNALAARRKVEAEEWEATQRKLEERRAQSKARDEAAKGPMLPKRDVDLSTEVEVSDRIESIESQLEKLEAVKNPKDFNKHHEKIKKLNERKDALRVRRANLAKELRDEAKKGKTGKTGNLSGSYAASPEDAKSDNPGAAAEGAFKKDLKRFANELNDILGWEPHRDKKGKDDSVATNISPIGGNGTILFWKPGTEFGAYVSVTVGRNYETQDLDVQDLFRGGGIMYRATTKASPYGGLQNRWTNTTVTPAELADLIRNEVDAQEERAAAKAKKEEAKTPPPQPEISAKDFANVRIRIKRAEELGLKVSGAKAWVKIIESGDAEKIAGVVGAKSILNQVNEAIAKREVELKEGAKEESPPSFGANNKFFTEDKANKAREILRQKLGGIHAGVPLDPEVMMAGIDLAGYYIEGGDRSFAQYSSKMIGDMGDAIRPYLKPLYLAIRNWPGFDKTGMNTEPELDEIDENAIGKEAETVDTTKEKDYNVAKENEKGGVAGESAESSKSDTGKRKTGADRLHDEGTAEGRSGDTERSGESAVGREGAGNEDAGGTVSDSERPAPSSVREPILPAETVGMGGLGAPGSAFESVSGAGGHGLVPAANGNDNAPERSSLVHHTNYNLLEKPSIALTKSQRRDLNARSKALLDRGAPYTDAEKDVLRQYTGEGGLGEAKKESLNQHYTDYDTIRAIFAALDTAGIQYRKALEPAVGSGNFVGMRPGATWTTVDIDPTNHRIASALYPDAKHYLISFEDYKAQGFDLVISNVPFLEIRKIGAKIRPDIKALHDFYFIHALARVKDNGVIAFITSRGTMDKKDNATRAEIVGRADVLGCFRLPGGHFERNAHTSVIADIIFLQKRPEGVEPSKEQKAINDAFVEATETKDGIVLNNYYHGRMSNFLGPVEIGKDKARFGKETYNIVGDADLSRIAIEYTPYDTGSEIARKEEEAPVGPPKEYHEFVAWENETKATVRYSKRVEYVTDREGNQYASTMAADLDYGRNLVTEGDSQQVYELDTAISFSDIEGSAKIYKPVPVKQARKLLQLQRIADHITDFQNTGSEASREAALTGIETYKSEHSSVHPSKDRGLRQLIRRTGEEAYLAELSSSFNDEFEPSAALKERTRYEGSGRASATKDSPLGIRAFASENNKGMFNVKKSELLGDEDVHDLLHNGYAVSDIADDGTVLQNEILYYSGNVYKKIDKAKDLKKKTKDPIISDSLDRQIARLEDIKPTQKTIDEIRFKGSEEWLYPILEKHGVLRINTETDPRSGWTHLSHPNDVYERYLNDRVLTDRKSGDGWKESISSYMARLHEAEEKLAEFIDGIKQRISENEELLNTVMHRYNSRFRAYVRPDYAAAKYLIKDVLEEVAQSLKSHPTIKGLRKNQIEWIIQALYEGKGINAHDVGGGKTFAAIVLARAMKRRGIAHKPLFVVPAKTIVKWERDIKTLFPDADVVNLGALTKDKRTKALFDLANRNADYVLISHEGFGQIRLPVDKELEYVRATIAENMTDAELTGREQSKLDEKVRDLVEIIQESPRDTRLTFDKLGIDMIVADEAHNFKNLAVTPSLVRHKLGVSFGINVREHMPPVEYDKETGKYSFVDPVSKKRRGGFQTKEVAQAALDKAWEQTGNLKRTAALNSARSYDFRFKANFIEERNNDSNVFLLTATPTPNKPMEVYTMLRHLSPHIFEEYGIRAAKDFSDIFFLLGTVQKPGEDSTTNVLRAIRNAQEFRGILNRFVDKISIEDMPWITIPEELEQKHFLDLSTEYEVIQEDLKERDKNRPRRPGPGDDNYISIYTAGRTASIDPRLYGGAHANVTIDTRSFDTSNDKLQYIIENVSASLNTNPNGGHLIFLDNAGHEQEARGILADNLHAEIKKELIGLGIKPEEIGIINGKVVTTAATGRETSSGDKNVKKQELADFYNEGKIKVLIGTTSSMGEGMDLQVKTAEIWHADIPWKPGDYRQRNGRGLRFGNENDKVMIHYLFMRGTFDAISFNAVINKKGWNEAIWDKEVADVISTEEEMATGAMPNREQIQLEMETNPIKRSRLLIQFEYGRILDERSGVADARFVARRRLETAGKDIKEGITSLEEREEKLRTLTPNEDIKDEQKRREQYEKSRDHLEFLITASRKKIEEAQNKVPVLQKRLDGLNDEYDVLSLLLQRFEEAFPTDKDGDIIVPDDFDFDAGARAYATRTGEPTDTRLRLSDSEAGDIPVSALVKIAKEVDTIFRKALPSDAYARVSLRLKPFIEVPKGTNVQQSLMEWESEKPGGKTVAGMTRFTRDFRAIVELSYNVPSADIVSGTAYHELFHVASSWLLPEKDRNAVLNHYDGNEETAAEAFRVFAQGKDGRVKRKAEITRIFTKLKRLLEKIKNALQGKGYFRPEDVFEKIMAGAYKEQSKDVRAARMGGDRLEVGAWHGGPHAFDRFSADKIGTGEGAQAFGWGLYFTGLEDVAKHYAEGLGKGELRINGRVWPQASDNLRQDVDNWLKSGNENYVKEMVNISIKNNERAIGKRIYTIQMGHDLDVLTEIKREIDNGTFYENVKYKPNSRNLYRVTLHKGKKPGEYTWLDWYESPSLEHMKSILRSADKGGIELRPRRDWKLMREDVEAGKLPDDFPTSDSIYKDISNALGSDREASLFLLRAGIDGIRYPSGTLSGIKDSDKYNYVVFDESAVTIEEHTRFRMIESGSPDWADEYARQYQILADPQNPETVNPEKPTKKQAKNIQKTETAAILREWNAVKATAKAYTPSNLPAGTMIEQILRSPEWYSHPVLRQLVDYAVERDDLYHQYLNELNKVEDPKVENETVTDATKVLAHKGLKWHQYMTGRKSKEYQQLMELIDEGDAERKEPEMFEAEMRERGIGEDVIRVWKLHRESYDKALDKLLAPLKALNEKMKEEAKFKGQTFTSPDFTSFQGDTLTLEEAIANMEQWRGSYAPRIREQGEWVVRAERKGEVVRYHKRTRLQAERFREKLKSEGWNALPVIERERLPEQTYQMIKVMETGKFLEEAAKKTIGDAQSQAQFLAAILEEAADLIRARGYRSHMIHRSEKGGVVKGYIEDPMERFVRYMSNISAGLAKADTAMMMTESFFGTGGNEGIDPMKDRRAYEVGRRYIEEQLRNTDATDRKIATAKSIASVKYLGFSPRSVAVNLTAMFSTVPAALHQYASKGKASFAQIGAALGTASKDYAKVMTGKAATLTADEKRFIEDMREKNYARAQYAREAQGTIRDAHGHVWSSIVSGAMYGFQKSEEWMRGTTMLAAYRIARKQGFGHAEAEKRAVDATGKAHGIYGKATMPIWAQGTNVGERIGQMLYVYAKFPHNYVQMLYDLGMNKKNARAFVWAVAAPVFLGGAAAIPFKDMLIGLLNAIWKIIGDDRDLEKMVWDGVRDAMGETAETVLRHGATGAAGIDLSGSLSIGVGLPRNLVELTGVFGGVLSDVGQAGRYAATGQPGRAIEKLLPTGIANIPRAIRELSGATTRSGYRVWDEEGNPYMPRPSETALRVGGFRSSRQATLAGRQWETKRELARFDERRGRIYEAYRAYLMQPSAEKRKVIYDRIKAYNDAAQETGGSVAYITRQSLTRQVRSMARPTKRQRAYLN